MLWYTLQEMADISNTCLYLRCKDSMSLKLLESLIEIE